MSFRGASCQTLLEGTGLVGRLVPPPETIMASPKDLQAEIAVSRLNN